MFLGEIHRGARHAQPLGSRAVERSEAGREVTLSELRVVQRLLEVVQAGLPEESLADLGCRDQRKIQQALREGVIALPRLVEVFQSLIEKSHGAVDVLLQTLQLLPGLIDLIETALDVGNGRGGADDAKLRGIGLGQPISQRGCRVYHRLDLDGLESLGERLPG